MQGMEGAHPRSSYFSPTEQSSLEPVIRRTVGVLDRCARVAGTHTTAVRVAGQPVWSLGHRLARGRHGQAPGGRDAVPQVSRSAPLAVRP